MSTIKKPQDFEKSLAKLNQLIEKMDAGDLSLDAALKCFEEGVTLIKQCQATLNTAEQKVQILTQKAGQSTLEDFTPHDE